MPTPRVLKVLILLVLATSATTAFLLARSRSDRSAPGTANPLAQEDRVKGLFLADFNLTGADGSRITNDIFQGKVTIVDFFFTHCPFICPTLTAKMAELTVALKDAPQAQFLSISVDPEHDTPERLAAYAKEHAGHSDRWTFATAHGHADGAADLRRLVTGGLKFDLDADPKNMINLPATHGDGVQMANIRHPPYFVVVGPKGEVLDIITATIPGEIEAAIPRLRAAAAKLK